MLYRYSGCVDVGHVIWGECVYVHRGGVCVCVYSRSCPVLTSRGRAGSAAASLCGPGRSTWPAPPWTESATVERPETARFSTLLSVCYSCTLQSVCYSCTLQSVCYSNTLCGLQQARELPNPKQEAVGRRQSSLDDFARQQIGRASCRERV